MYFMTRSAAVIIQFLRWFAAEIQMYSLLVRVHSACLLRLLYTLNLKKHAIDACI